MRAVAFRPWEYEDGTGYEVLLDDGSIWSWTNGRGEWLLVAEPLPRDAIEHCAHNVPLAQPCSQCNATEGATPDICPACGEAWPLAVDYDRITCQTCLARGMYQTIPLDDFTTIVEEGE
jgi:hypothetical protein